MYNYLTHKKYYSPSQAQSTSGFKRIKAGIIGGAGYTGGELIRLLLNHPFVDISFVNSKSNAGKLISNVHTDLIGETNLTFSADLNDEIDVLLLCLGHGDAKKFLDEKGTALRKIFN